jgi:drug/metabolite transporter (DMT)-like permease
VDSHDPSGSQANAATEPSLLREAANSDLKRAALLAIVAEGILTLMDAIIKILSTRYPTLEIAFLRFASGSLWATLVIAFARPGWPSREAVLFNASRAFLAVLTATSFFYALSQLPLAECMALSFLAPLFMVLFGALLLRESINIRIGLGLAGGMLGMLVIVGGRLGASQYSTGAGWGAAAAVGSAVLYALVVVTLRARATIDPLATIVLFQNLGPALLLALPAFYAWTDPSASDLAIFGLVGMLGVFGHALMVRAFAHAEAASLAPVHYVTLVWGMIYGLIFFGDWGGITTFAGALIIVAATLITRRETYLYRAP